MKEEGIKFNYHDYKSKICLKTKEIIRLLESEGWIMVRQKGNHKQYKHPLKSDLITVPDHGANKELSPGVLSDIKKKAGWK